MKSWEKEIHQQLAHDDSALKKAIGGFGGYKKSLEDICSHPISTSSTDQLAMLFAELEEASLLPLKYKSYPKSRLEEASLGLTGRLNMIAQLDAMLYDTFSYAISDIAAQWKNAKQQFKRWKIEYGMDELKKERASLNSVADTYSHLLNGFGGDLAANNLHEIERYLRFIDTITSLDLQFAQFRKNYHPQGKPAKEKLNVQLRDLTDLKKEYVRACTINRPLTDRLFTQNTIFGYREKLMEIDGYIAEIAGLLAPKPEPISPPEVMQEQATPAAKPIADTSAANPAMANAGTIDILAQKIIQEQKEPVPGYNSTPIQAPDDPHTYATPDPTPNQRSTYRPIVRNQTNRFDLTSHMLVIGFPSMAYMKLADTLLGRAETRHEVKKLVPFTEQLKKLPAARNLQDMDYLYHMEYALREDLNRGSIDPLIANNSNYWEIAHTALATLQEYIQKSEEALGLDQNTIQAHMAISGPKNPYNRMLPIL